MDLREIIVFNYQTDKISLNLEAVMLSEDLRALYIYRKDKPLGTQEPTEEGGLFEFKMIWWIANPAASGFKMGLPVSVLIEKSRNEFAPVNWRKTTLFTNALDAYIELMKETNPIYSLLRSHMIALKTATKSIEIMTDSLNDYVSKFALNIEDPDSVKILGNVQAILGELLSDGDKLNDRIKSFKVIHDAYGKEEAKIRKIRGGKEYLISMDPDNEVEN